MTFISDARITVKRATTAPDGVAFMTVHTDESSAASWTCSVTGCCHAVLMAACSTLWARGRRSCTGPSTSALLAGRHIQLMPTAVEDVLELSPPARRILADMEVRLSVSSLLLFEIAHCNAPLISHHHFVCEINCAIHLPTCWECEVQCCFLYFNFRVDHKKWYQCNSFSVRVHFGNAISSTVFVTTTPLHLHGLSYHIIIIIQANHSPNTFQTFSFVSVSDRPDMRPILRW